MVKTMYAMRRLSIFALFLALLATSCSYTDEQMDIKDNGVNTLQRFVARIDNSHDTRITSSICSDGSIQMLWHADDKILVTDNLGGRKLYNLIEGEGTIEAVFAIDDSFQGSPLAEDVPLCAIASHSSGVFIQQSENEIAYLHPKISKTQNHTDTHDSLRCVMAAQSGQTDGETLSFDFKLIASAARFDIKLEDGELIQKITMETESTSISGWSDIDWSTLITTPRESTSYPTITLYYANTPASPYADGWCTMYPIDWTTVEGNVYYTITTNKNIYKFCKKPTKKFEAGFVYTFPLDITKFELVDSEEELSDGKYCKLYSEGTISVAQVRATDSTISIGWCCTHSNIDYIGNIQPDSRADYSEEITKNYKVALYSDAKCQNLVVSVNNIPGSLFTDYLVPPRFAFTGLKPATTYYAKVFNNTDTTESKAIEVATIASAEDKNAIVTNNAKAGDLIVFENFAGLIYGGELSARASGISRSDRGSLTEIKPITGVINASSSTDYLYVHAGTEIGLFNTLKGIVDDFGLQDWGYIAPANSCICARAGFIKLGTTGKRAAICTPELDAIPEGKAATVRVKFRAAPYGDYNKSSINRDERYLAVRALVDPTCTNYNVTYNTEACNTKFVTLSSIDITVWEECEVTLTNVPSGGRISIGGGHEETVTNRFLLDDIRVYVEEITDYKTPTVEDFTYLDPISGTVKYNDGTPAAGVAVSDGFSVVQTDSEGKYTISPHRDCWYIYYSIPADCQVPINEFGQPCFYTKFDRSVSTYDFTLTKGTKETEFTLFCLADPQCKDNNSTATNGRNGDRFKNESVPAIKAHAQTKTTPCYGVTLGDIVYSEDSRNNEAFMDDMRDFMANTLIGMPIFQTMGNHDYKFFSSSKPIYADATSSTFDIRIQRAFEDVFGPINYSWNRGDAHIISMRNMHWSNNTNASDSSYSLSFTTEQVKWLREDLETVPKDKLIIFCVHIPMLNQSAASAVTALLQQFPNCHIMSGHTHYMRNEPTRTAGIYEHVHAAVSGQWWWSNINGDGVPNGFGVYEISGNKIVNGYYQGINEGMNDRNYQIRLYRGDLKAGAENRSFNLQHGSDVIIANVFNASPKWKVEIFADGVSEGEMTFIKEKKYQYHNDYNKYSQFSQDIPNDSCQDWWAIGYHIGVIKRESSGYYVNNFHMYKHTLTNKSATSIKVVATDEYGNKYEQTKITGDYDYSEIIYHVPSY